MALIIEQVKEDRPRIAPAASGGYSAVCCGVYDLGLQPNTFDKSKPDRREIAISFELDSVIENEGDFNGKRRLVTSRCSVFYSKDSNLMKLITGWFGKTPTEEFMQTFDWDSLIGKPAYITMIGTGKYDEDGNEKTKIGNVIDLPKGMPAMTPETLPSDIPNWIIDLRAKSISFQAK